MVLVIVVVHRRDGYDDNGADDGGNVVNMVLMVKLLN